MLYYRFRPFSELTLKELLYNEMYFASPEECNDPFDSKTFYTFPNDNYRWSKLLQLAIQNANLKFTQEDLKPFVDFYCQRCPLTFDEAKSIQFLREFNPKNVDEEIIKDILSNHIPDILTLYEPSTRYFVSFAKECTEPLMWSHYADKHKGFCLIFRSINNKIKQFEFQKKHQITRNTPNSFSQRMSYQMQEAFDFTDIEYFENVTTSSAFFHLPVFVTGESANDEQINAIRNEQESHYKQKGISWNYEKESRLILPPPPSWLFGGHIEYTKQERLFHYDPGHLVGIIYGARMTKEEKNRIHEVLKERKDWIYSYPNYTGIEFNFVEFSASLSAKERAVTIKPISMNPHSTVPLNNKDFDRLYQEWQEGWGFEKSDRGSRKIKIE